MVYIDKDIRHVISQVISDFCPECLPQGARINEWIEIKEPGWCLKPCIEENLRLRANNIYRAVCTLFLKIVTDAHRLRKRKIAVT